MNYRVLGAVTAAAAIAFAQPAIYIAQEANKALEILAAARKAIGDKKVDALKTFSVQSSLQRNVGSMQMNSDVEIGYWQGKWTSDSHVWGSTFAF